MPAAVAGLGAGIDLGDQLPPGLLRIDILAGLVIKARRRAVGGIQGVDLRGAGFDVPGIREHLLDVDDAAEINEQPPAFGAGVKEEVGGRLVFLGRQPSVGKDADAAAVAVPHAVNDRDLGGRGGRILGGRRHLLELEFRRRVLKIVITHLDLHLGRRPCRRQ